MFGFRGIYPIFEIFLNALDKLIALFYLEMYLDITKYIKSCKKEKLEIINNIVVRNLY